MSSIESRILTALQSVLGAEKVPLHEPRLGALEQEYVRDCIDSTFVSSVGKYVDQFESDLAEYTGSHYAVVVVNGTAALHIALRLAGVEDGDEVIVPALTFVATAAAVTYCNASPLFADSELRTLGLCPVTLRRWLEFNAHVENGICKNNATGKVIRAMVPVHIFGHPCDMDGLNAVAEEFGIAVVEDAAEALGSTLNGRHVGTFGKLGTLSFNGNKIVTTGGGGAILTDDEGLARRAKHITTTAKKPHRWQYEHDEVGFNYRMPNINAALGCAQIKRMQEFLESKRRLHLKYLSAFETIDGVSIMTESESCRSNYWLQALRLEEGAAQSRDRILAATNDAGVMTRPIWTLLHRMAPYSRFQAMPLSNAEAAEQCIINIPSSSGLA